VKTSTEPSRLNSLARGEKRAGEGQEGALGEELAQQAPAARPQGRTHGQLLLASGHARHHEVGHVGAGNQEDEGHGGEEDQKGGPGAPYQLFPQGQEVRAIAGLAGERLGVGGAQALGYGVNVGLGPVQRHSFLHSGEGHDHARPSVLGVRRVGTERARRGGHVDVVGVRVLGQRGQDADHGVDAVVHLEAPPHRGGIAPELRQPELVAQQQHRLGSVGLVVGLERTAQQGLHP
jgi:hypothetical protein